MVPNSIKSVNCLASAVWVRRMFVLALCGVALGCGAAEPMGQFGNYRRTHQVIHLPGCDTLKVFRIKYWVFDYDAPAIQFEYSSPTHVADSASSYALAGRIWKSLEPYVDVTGVRRVILTETVLDTLSVPPLMTSKTKSFGVILSRDSSETWRFTENGRALPARSLNDNDENLSDVNGAPMSPAVFAKEMNEIIASTNKAAGK